MTDKGTAVDRAVTTWMRDEAGTGEPVYLAETLELLDWTPQSRWRGVIARLLPVAATPPVMIPRAVLYLALVALLTVALAAAAILVASQPRRPSPSGLAANGLIAYDDGMDVYIAYPDGSRPIAIKGGLGFEYSATYSPDGTLIAFWSSRTAAGGALFVASGDGTGTARQLGAGTLLEGPPHVPPAWSPDSRSIAYPGWAPTGQTGIYIASVETGLTRHVAGTDASAGYPAWSPDGRWIAFRADVDGRTRLKIVSPGGGDVRELTSTDGSANAFTQIAWSPDGSKLVYHRPWEEAAGQTVVAVYDLEHQAERRVSEGKRHADAPTWSTDGQRIAYMEEVPGDGTDFYRNLIIASADGRDHRNRGRVADCIAVWSPDSRFLLSYAPGCFNEELVVVPVEGGPAIPISLPDSIVGSPSWQRLAP